MRDGRTDGRTRRRWTNGTEGTLARAAPSPPVPLSLGATRGRRDRWAEQNPWRVFHFFYFIFFSLCQKRKTVRGHINLRRLLFLPFFFTHHFINPPTPPPNALTVRLPHSVAIALWAKWKERRKKKRRGDEEGKKKKRLRVTHYFQQRTWLDGTAAENEPSPSPTSRSRWRRGAPLALSVAGRRRCSSECVMQSCPPTGKLLRRSTLLSDTTQNPIYLSGGFSKTWQRPSMPFAGLCLPPSKATIHLAVVGKRGSQCVSATRFLWVLESERLLVVVFPPFIVKEEDREWMEV